MTSQIWVDADACPKVIKDILFRASIRTGISLTLVANHALSTPAQAFIRSVQVESGFDVADNYIVQHLNKNDLVITADIPLAAEVVEKEALALNPRGEPYTKETIRQRLAMRNLMEELRNTGEVSGGPSALSQADRQAFANALDRWLSQV